MSIIENVQGLLAPVLQAMGYELYELSFVPEGRDMRLTVRIDKPGTRIGLDQIVEVSERLSKVLDDANLIEVNYVLDVSSAGAERRIDLQDLPKYVGSYVNLHLKNPYKGLNTLEGELTEVHDGTLILSYRDKTRTLKAEIRLDDVDRARRAIKF